MAYFGRRPEKPGSVPGAGSGFEIEKGQRAVRRAVRILRDAAGGRPERLSRQGRVNRNVRAARSAR